MKEGEVGYYSVLIPNGNGVDAVAISFQQFAQVCADIELLSDGCPSVGSNSLESNDLGLPSGTGVESLLPEPKGVATGTCWWGIRRNVVWVRAWLEIHRVFNRIIGISGQRREQAGDGQSATVTISAGYLSGGQGTRRLFIEDLNIQVFGAGESDAVLDLSGQRENAVGK